MTAIDRCSRCYGPLGGDVRRVIVIKYYRDNLKGGPLSELRNVICKECMESFLDWKEMKE